ncbi:MAG: zinc-dependent dehydrogenase [Candidatus Omnitrophota bacterium]
MRVGMYYNNNDVRVEEMPVPKIAPGELLVKVASSGICGSDVMEWYRIKKAPLVLGHEIAGEIVEIGEGVTKYKKGERVFVSHHIPCNTCRYCLNGHHTVCETLRATNYDPGGFSEYIRIPALNVDRGTFLLPDTMSFDQAVFIEPVACAVRAQRIAGLKQGQSVLVLGSGISGVIHIALAKGLGAGKIVATDVNEYRLKAARGFGADEALNAKERLNGLYDLVIVCTSALSAFYQALEAVDSGGTVLFFAPTEPEIELTIPVNDFWKKCVTLVPSYGNSPRDAQIAINLINSGRINVNDMITHRLPLSQLAQGFTLVSEAKNSIKVIIHI